MQEMTVRLGAVTKCSTLRDAAQMFARYDFRAIPVVDDAGHMLGVVPYRDVMGLKHRFVE